MQSEFPKEWRDVCNTASCDLRRRGSEELIEHSLVFFSDRYREGNDMFRLKLDYTVP